MTFTGDLDEMRRWAPHLDNSFVAVQGPPGTGKTYSGAHLIAELIRSGQRVGASLAFSHSAIDNLLSAVVAVCRERGDPELLRAVRRGPEPRLLGAAGRDVLGRQQKRVPTPSTTCGRNHLAVRRKDHAATGGDTLIVDEAASCRLLTRCCARVPQPT
ncbi:MAG: hypothetical protein IPH38_09040 [Candidatus Microthrix sp.]|nr:hypothetical protein [Candidatus Microthrix sp.]MBK7019719.1 hypothetical protein [Candidatus Microthrix sp.]